MCMSVCVCVCVCVWCVCVMCGHECVHAPEKVKEDGIAPVNHANYALYLDTCVGGTIIRSIQGVLIVSENHNFMHEQEKKNSTFTAKSQQKLISFQLTA